jgi:hypothetical protein
MMQLILLLKDDQCLGSHPNLIENGQVKTASTVGSPKILALMRPPESMKQCNDCLEVIQSWVRQVSAQGGHGNAPRANVAEKLHC